MGQGAADCIQDSVVMPYETDASRLLEYKVSSGTLASINVLGFLVPVI